MVTLALSHNLFLRLGNETVDVDVVAVGVDVALKATHFLLLSISFSSFTSSLKVS